MSDLSDVTIDELWDEIRGRCNLALLAYIKRHTEGGDPNMAVRMHKGKGGSNLEFAGLAAVAHRDVMDGVVSALGGSDGLEKDT